MLSVSNVFTKLRHFILSYVQHLSGVRLDWTEDLKNLHQTAFI